MKLRLDGWKKVSSAPDHTVMQHESGHQIKVMHKPLSPKVRGQLAALPKIGQAEMPMATRLSDGGEVDTEKASEIDPRLSDQTSFKDGGDVNKQDPTQQHLLPGDEQPNKIEKMVVSKAKHDMASSKKQRMYAHGGDVDPQGNPVNDPNKSVPININVNSAPVPQDMVNPNPGSQAAPMEGQPTKVTEAEKQTANPAYSSFGATPEQAVQAMTNPINSTNTANAPLPLVQTVNPNDVAKAQAQVANIQAANNNATPQTQPDAANMNVPDIVTAYQQGMQGIQAEATAQGQLGQNQAEVLRQQEALRHKSFGEVQGQIQQNQDHFQSIAKDIQDQHIDPNAFWSRPDAPSKLAVGIGLILGGIGAGATHGPNMALDFLNRNIDRDVEAQRANLGKSQSLLQANLQQFGNIRDANDMTRLQMQLSTMNQLQEAAAKSANPLAQARAQQLQAQMQQQAAPTFQRLAVRQALTQPNSATSQLFYQDPAKYVRFIADEKDQPALYKEISEAQGTTKAANNIMNVFDQVAKLQTLGQRLGNPIQSKNQIDALVDPTIAGLSKETAGRFTEQDAQYIGSLLRSKLTDNAQTTALRRVALQRLITQKMNFPTMAAYDLDPSKFASTAGASMNAPGPETQTRNGIQYVKVPGGWKRAQ